MVTPDENVRRELGLTTTEDVIALRRLFLVDGEPLAVFEHRIKQVITLHALEAGHFPSLNRILHDAGFEVTDALRTIGATVLALEDADLLHATAGAPALLIRQTSFTHAGTAVSYARFLVRADRYEYRVDVGTRVVGQSRIAIGREHEDEEPR
jgi:DNA-binding GntR family transcriptional regulator